MGMPKNVLGKPGPLKVYVATSWRNKRYETVVAAIRELGMEVYDFKNSKTAFGWEELLTDGELSSGKVSALRFCGFLKFEVPRTAYAVDMSALRQADVVVMLLPCGKSSHLELGIAAGRGQKTIIVLEDPVTDLELTYLASDYLCANEDEAISILRSLR